MYTGIAQKGDGSAGKLGFPTVNIPLDDAHISGIYAAKVTVGGQTYSAAAYANAARKVLEAHILDFSGDLYGKEIAIELCHKIREDARFENETNLRNAIRKDVEAARAYFA